MVVVVRDGQTEQFVGLSFFHAFYGAALRNSLFSLPCFYPPFSRQANVTAQAGRQAGRRRICLVLSVPVPRVKRKLSHTHTMHHSHNPTPHNTPQSLNKRVTGHDHELRRSRGPPQVEKEGRAFHLSENGTLHVYMYISTVTKNHALIPIWLHIVKRFPEYETHKRDAVIHQ